MADISPRTFFYGSVQVWISGVVVFVLPVPDSPFGCSLKIPYASSCPGSAYTYPVSCHLVSKLRPFNSPMLYSVMFSQSFKIEAVSDQVTVGLIYLKWFYHTLAVWYIVCVLVLLA